MQNSLKIVAIVALFLGGASIAQDGKPATKQKPSAGKMVVIDAEKHDQMKNNVKEMDEQIQALKRCVTDERGAGGDSNHDPAAIAHQRASDEQIEALQRSVKELRQQLETSPHYVDQTNKLRP